MPVQPPLIPIIQIDSGETQNVDVSSSLLRIYYQPVGYYRTTKKLYEAFQKARYDFSLEEVHNWLERQAIHQIHKPHPRYIPRASFTSITTSNKVHQVDIFCLNIVNVASRYKASIPIGAYSVKDRQGILTSKTIAKAIEKIYDDPECFLTWPKVFLTDKDSEFRGDCEKLMREHNVKIQKAKSKRIIGIVESYNKTLAKRLFRIQDAHNLLTLHLSEKFQAWVKNLLIIVEDINNSITRLIDLSPAMAIKKKRVIFQSSKIREGPMGYDEPRLTYDMGSLLGK